MSQVEAIVLCVVFSVALGGWVDEMVSPRGIDLGHGLSLHLDKLNKTYGGFFEKHAFRLDYGDFGVSVGKSPKKNSLAVDLIVKKESNISEGRGKKNDNLMPAILGFKGASLVSLTLFSMAAFVLKALGVAKIALVVTTILLIAKLMHNDHHHHSGPEYVEIAHHGDLHTAYSDYHPMEADMYNHPSASSNYYAYSNYFPNMAANQNVMKYATVQQTPAAATNNTAQGQQVAASAAIKRKDVVHKIKVPILTVRRYTVET